MNTSKRPLAVVRRRAFSLPGRAAATRCVTRAGREEVALWLPALAVLLLYARTLGFAFVWDDLDLIVRNAALQGGDWPHLLTQDFWQSTGGGTGMWRPLVTLSFRVDGVLSHWQPWTFHLGNLLLHAASAVLLARLARARQLPLWAAVGAGLVYATAPALTECVAWNAGRADAFVVLATLGALLSARRWRAAASRLAAAGTLLCVALALLAKETALVLPLLLAADAADARISGLGSGSATAGAHSRRWLPAWSALAVVLLWAAAHRALVPAPAHPGSPGAALGMAALVWAHLAWLLPWAAHSPLLDVWQPPVRAVAALAWVALVCVLIACAWAVRARRPLLLPVALLVAPLLPVAAAALLESGVRFAERSLALPAAGMALALATLAAAVAGVPATSRLARARQAGPVALGCWLLSQTVVCVPLVGVWRDDLSRIRRIVQVRPHDPDALLGMADLLGSLGRPEEAEPWIARAEAADPGGGGGALVARASNAFRAGQFDAALAAAERARERDPHSLAAGMIRVRSLARLGRSGEAVRAGDLLWTEHPGAPAAAGALGVARLAAGDVAGACELLRGASEHLLDDAGLAWQLGRAAIATGDIALARTAFERAVRAAPEFYEAWLGVADTRARLGDEAGAEAALVRAAALPAASDGRVEALRARAAARR